MTTANRDITLIGFILEENRDPAPPRRPIPSVPPLASAEQDAQFECEEGESARPTPIPGLIRSGRRGEHWRADVGYTTDEKRPSASFELDRRTVEEGWTAEDGSASSLPGLIVSAASEVTSKVDLLGEEQSNAGMGLCATCEHQTHCTFPRSEAGVWRCDEYV